MRLEAVRTMPDAGRVDVEAAQPAVADLLAAQGRDISDPHLVDKPRRVVEAFTEQPLGAGVVLEAEHLCMSIPGVQAAGTLTRTSAFRGVLAEPGALRDRFLG